MPSHWEGEGKVLETPWTLKCFKYFRNSDALAFPDHGDLSLLTKS